MIELNNSKHSLQFFFSSVYIGANLFIIYGHKYLGKFGSRINPRLDLQRYFWKVSNKQIDSIFENVWRLDTIDK